MKKTAIIMMVMAMVAGLFATPMSAKAVGHSGHGYFYDWIKEDFGDDNSLTEVIRNIDVDAVLDGRYAEIKGHNTYTGMYIMYVRDDKWEYHKIIAYGYKRPFTGFVPCAAYEVAMKYSEVETIIDDDMWLPDTLFNPENWES